MISFSKIIFLFTLISNTICSKAQDKLLLRGTLDTLMVRILELGVNEIKYQTWPVAAGIPIKVEKKSNIRKIVFENGTVLKYAQDEFTNAEHKAKQNKLALKADLFAPTRRVISFSVEYSIKPGRSVEGGFGYIGLGTYNNDFLIFKESNGGFMRMGLKLINTPNYAMNGMRYTHILKGGYLRPELVALYQENYGYNSNYILKGSIHYNNINEIKVKGLSCILNIGKQWVENDLFCVDLFLGFGIGSKKYEAYYQGVKVYNISSNFNELLYSATGGFGFISLNNENGGIHITLQAGLKIGVLIGGAHK